jgi:hypothetical protein
MIEHIPRRVARGLMKKKCAPAKRPTPQPGERSSGSWKTEGKSASAKRGMIEMRVNAV